MKGVCHKIETLQDGSLKLSLYCNKEQLAEAVKFSYQEIDIKLFREGEINQKVLESKKIREFAKTIMTVAEDLLSEANEEG